jgi:hypothetical protein
MTTVCHVCESLHNAVGRNAKPLTEQFRVNGIERVQQSGLDLQKKPNMRNEKLNVEFVFLGKKTVVRECFILEIRDDKCDDEARQNVTKFPDQCILSIFKELPICPSAWLLQGNGRCNLITKIAQRSVPGNLTCGSILRFSLRFCLPLFFSLGICRLILQSQIHPAVEAI